jgi:uncharacterized protein (DUF4415 family)
MPRKQQFSKARRDGRSSAGRTTGAAPSSRQRSSNPAETRAQATSGKERRSTPRHKAQDRKGARLTVANPELYRPLKKPVTLRLDADVLAWFRREGRRYQTRINRALRQVMEREVRNSGR